MKKIEQLEIGIWKKLRSKNFKNVHWKLNGNGFLDTNFRKILSKKSQKFHCKLYENGKMRLKIFVFSISKFLKCRFQIAQLFLFQYFVVFFIDWCKIWLRIRWKRLERPETIHEAGIVLEFSWEVWNFIFSEIFPQQYEIHDSDHLPRFMTPINVRLCVIMVLESSH